MYAGARVAGRAAVVAHLAAVAECHAAYGSAAYDLDAPDAQALQARLLLPWSAWLEGFVMLMHSVQ